MPGAIGRITELHGTDYQQHTGFGLYFESKVACELSEFLRRLVQFGVPTAPFVVAIIVEIMVIPLVTLWH